MRHLAAYKFVRLSLDLSRFKEFHFKNAAQRCFEWTLQGPLTFDRLNIPRTPCEQQKFPSNLHLRQLLLLAPR